MADEMTRADSVRRYLTGASSDGAAQSDADLSLGNYRSSTVTGSQSISVSNPISNVTVEYAAGANGEGAGTMTATGVDDLTWTPPGGSAGPAVTIANGETKILEGSSAPDSFIRVARTSATNLTGTATVDLSDVYNNAVALDDVTSAERTAGDTEYRCLCIKNESASQVTGITAQVKTLGTQVVSDAAQLPASGNGEVQTSSSLADWPTEGYALIKQSGGTLREIVHYTSRTGTTLTVPAAGRGLLGTSEGAGASDDTVDAIPGIAIGLDDPTSQPSGSFVDNTGADEDTAPGGVSFSTPTVDGDALSIGTLAAGYIYGVWIKREMPATGPNQPNLLNAITWKFDAA